MRLPRLGVALGSNLRGRANAFARHVPELFGRILVPALLRGVLAQPGMRQQPLGDGGGTQRRR